MLNIWRGMAPWRRLCYAIILLWKSRRKLRVEIPLCQLTSISECCSTIRERLIHFQSDDEARAIQYFIHTDGHLFGPCTVSVFKDVWEKSSYSIITAVSHDLMLLSQVSNNKCATRNEHHNRLGMNNTGKTPYDLRWPTCDLLWKNLREAPSQGSH